MNTADLVRDHTRKYAVTGALSLVALGVAIALPPSPARIDMMFWGLYFPCVGVMLTNFLPSDHQLLCNAEPAESDKSGRFAIVLGIILLAIAIYANPITMIVMTLFDLPPNSVEMDYPHHPPINASPLVAGAVLIQSLLIFISEYASSAMVLVSRVLRAPWANESLAPDQWVRMVGTVDDPTPVVVDARPAAFAMVTDTEEVPGSDPNIVVKKFENVGTFMVRSGQTWVEIDPRGIHWSGPSNHTLKSLTPSGHTRTISTDYLPIGAKVLVVGRLRPRQSSVYREVPYTLSATREDPVLVLRTDDPEALLDTYRMAMRLRRLGLILSVVFIAAIITVCVVGLPSLPAFQLPANSSGSD